MKSQAETNLADPNERFVWAFRGIEFNGMPMAIPDAVLEKWSRHLSQCGFLHAQTVIDMLGDTPQEKLVKDRLSGEQTIHYQPPLRGQDHSFNTSGEWVPIDQEIREPVVPVVSQLTSTEKAKLIEELKGEGLID